MQRLSGQLAAGLFGALLGAFLGAVVGATEYLLVFSGSYSGDAARAYREVVWPYALLGALAGLGVAVLHALLRGRRTSNRRMRAELAGLLSGLVVLPYLLIWSVLELSAPLLRPVNLLAYAASLGAAAAMGWLTFRLTGYALARRERAGSGPGPGRVLAVALGIVTVGLLFLPAAFTGGARPGSVPPTSVADSGPPLPNLVFILVDTLRADHLPFYGYSRETAPRLSELARRSTLLSRAYALSPDTRPSVATIFSSLYPAVHGMNHQDSFLSGSFVTLAEVLRDAGYETFGVSANGNVSPTFGYSQGFDEFRVKRLESAFRLTRLGWVVNHVAEELLGRERFSQLLGEPLEFVPRADAVTDLALAWAREPRSCPCFLYVHYIDPHWPYEPPEDYLDAFEFESDPPVRRGGVDPLSLVTDDRKTSFVRDIIDRYDEEILFTDRHVGRLLDELEALGMLEDAVVVVTSDHGEEFFEHGRAGHSTTLYQEVLHVPLLIHGPGRVPEGVSFGSVTGLIDLMPTVLGLLGLDPPASAQGRNLAAAIAAARGPSAAMPSDARLFTQLIGHRSEQEMLRLERYKLIRHVRGDREGLEELYDLEVDPLERVNLAAERPDQLASSRSELAALSRTLREAVPSAPREMVLELDPDTERSLRELGYIE